MIVKYTSVMKICTWN